MFLAMVALWEMLVGSQNGKEWHWHGNGLIGTGTSLQDSPGTFEPDLGFYSLINYV